MSDPTPAERSGEYVKCSACEGRGDFWPHEDESDECLACYGSGWVKPDEIEGGSDAQ